MPWWLCKDVVKMLTTMTTTTTTMSLTKRLSTQQCLLFCALEPNCNFTISPPSFRAFGICFLMGCLNGTLWDASLARLMVAFIYCRLISVPVLWKKVVSCCKTTRRVYCRVHDHVDTLHRRIPACYHFKVMLARIIIQIQVTTSTATERWWSFALHDDEWRATT